MMRWLTLEGSEKPTGRCNVKVEVLQLAQDRVSSEEQGRGRVQVVRKSVSNKLANASVRAIRSFYATYDVTVRMRGRHKLPRPKVANTRMKVGAE